MQYLWRKLNSKWKTKRQQLVFKTIGGSSSYDALSTHTTTSWAHLNITRQSLYKEDNKTRFDKLHGIDWLYKTECKIQYGSVGYFTVPVWWSKNEPFNIDCYIVPTLLFWTTGTVWDSNIRYEDAWSDMIWWWSDMMWSGMRMYGVKRRFVECYL